MTTILYRTYWNIVTHSCSVYATGLQKSCQRLTSRAPSLFQCIIFRLCLKFLGNYSCLKVDLIFTRDRSFYFTTVFIPGIILVTSSFITFWLEWNAVPARVMIGWFNLLSFDTYGFSFKATPIIMRYCYVTSITAYIGYTTR